MTCDSKIINQKRIGQYVISGFSDGHYMRVNKAGVKSRFNNKESISSYYDENCAFNRTALHAFVIETERIRKMRELTDTDRDYIKRILDRVRRELDYIRQSSDYQKLSEIIEKLKERTG